MFRNHILCLVMYFIHLSSWEFDDLLFSHDLSQEKVDKNSLTVPWKINKTSSPKGNDRSPESNVPRSNLISKNI